MTTQELVHDALPAYKAPTTYSEIIRDEVRAECGRRGISQRRLALAMGLSQPSISERWRGKIPWTLDEVERLEPVLGLDRGALLFRCARRDSNPQPSDLSPLEVFLAAAEDERCWCRREGCTERYYVPCDCPCHPWADGLGAVDTLELAA